MQHVRDLFPAAAEAPPSRIIGQRSAPVYQRHAFDWYREDARAVEKLFAATGFCGVIHDPACGSGNIPTIATRLGYAATGSDIVDRGYGETGVDFLSDLRARDNIVSNPPYALAEAFVRHALTVAERRIAMLVRLAFLEGQGRHRRLFMPHPPEACAAATAASPTTR